MQRPLYCSFGHRYNNGLFVCIEFNSLEFIGKWVCLFAQNWNIFEFIVKWACLYAPRLRAYLLALNWNTNDQLIDGVGLFVHMKSECT